MTREQTLADFFTDRINTPLVWGESDCCLFVADALKSISGVDIAAWFRKRYASRSKAFKLLRQFAGGSVEDTVT